MTRKQFLFIAFAAVLGAYSAAAHENSGAAVTRSAAWQDNIKKAQSGDTILVPAGKHIINTGAYPTGITVQNVTLLFQPGTELHFTDGLDSGKIYTLSGFGASKSETLKIPPSGVTVQIKNPDYRHGAMVTVRNKGQNNAVVVEWFGSADRNNSYCTNHKAELSGPTAQTSCFVPPQPESGRASIFIRSATQETCPVEIEILNWANGPGCR